MVRIAASFALSLPIVCLSDERPDVHIEFVNECGHDVSFAWYETTCSGSSPNLLFLNERVGPGGSTSRRAQTASFAGGRIYAWAADTASTVPAMSANVFTSFMSESKEEKCGATYEAYRLGTAPFMKFGAFAELTLTHTAKGIINDADISMVDHFYLPMSWEWSFEDTSGLNRACYNTSLTATPSPADCNANGGKWVDLTATPYTAAPSGFCRAPNMLCQPSGQPAEHAICSHQLAEFHPLIEQLQLIAGDLSAANAFKWATKDTSLFPGQVWTCSGFQNTPLFDMAEMCAAINRGLCDLSQLGSMSAADFGAWTKNTCGTKQNSQPPSSWFAPGLVRNPYVYWLRHTLGGTTYSFSQDEGLHGGNSNCNDVVGSRAPDYSRVTACPGGSGPSPASTTAAPAPVPSGWEPCSTGPCCDPRSAVQQLCPGGIACQACGGAVACQCPTHDDVLVV